MIAKRKKNNENKEIFRSIAMLFALALVFCALVPTTKVQAMEESAQQSVEHRYITANGVRLYKYANPDSAVLALMYYGDRIDYYPDIRGDGAYSYLVYMVREIVPRAGYVNSSYTSTSL